MGNSVLSIGIRDVAYMHLAVDAKSNPFTSSTQHSAVLLKSGSTNPDSDTTDLDHAFNSGGRDSKLGTEIQSRDLCLGRLSTNTGVIPAFRAPTTSS